MYQYYYIEITDNMETEELIGNSSKQAVSFVNSLSYMLSQGDNEAYNELKSASSLAEVNNVFSELNRGTDIQQLIIRKKKV